MDTLKLLSDSELKTAYDSVFREAFPPEELKPLSAIMKMRSEGQYDTLGLFREGEALGFICCWLDAPYVLIDYLCVAKGSRNGGIGAEILRRAAEYYPKGTIFIGEVEAPTGDEESDKMILRRLGFYERSGAKAAGYDCALFGVHYKTIYWADTPPDTEELIARHDGFYRRNFNPGVYARAIQLPLREGEKPLDRRIWDERPDSIGDEEL